MKKPTVKLFAAPIICLAASLFAAFGLFAQKPELPGPDFFEAALTAATSDTARLPILEKLGRSYAQIDPDRSFFCFKKLDSLAKLTRMAKFEASAANHLSFCHGMEGRNELAIFHAKNAIRIYDSLGEKKQIGRITENLSVFYIRDGHFKEALEINLKLVDELKKSGDQEGLFHTYQRIATIYGEQKQSAEALRHDRLALAVAEKCRSEFLRGTALGTIGDDLSHWPDSSAKAEIFYKTAISIFEKADTCPSCIAQFSSTLARFYLTRSRVADAGFFVKKGLDFLKKTDDPFAQFEIEMAAAQLAIIENRPADALFFLKNNEELKQITSASEVEFEKNWAQYLFATGQHEAGFLRMQRAFALQDSVAAEVYDEGISQLRVGFETEKKEQEAALLSAQNQNLKVKNKYFLAVAGLLALGFFYGIWSISRLQRQKKRIEKQRAKLHDLNATKDKFFAIIAHDLRGPIISFHGLIKKINWLIARGETDRVSQLGASVDEAASGLNKLLDNLLAWALIQRGTMPYNPENINLREETEAGVAAFKNALDTKNIDLEMAVSDDLNVFADRAALACFVRNLTDNALKYTPNGSKINISARQTDDKICLSVADNGPGMDEEQVARLLSEKSPDNTAVASKGTGLGLMLCRELAELNRGKLEVKSSPGEGTVISIWLPKAA